jgi:hypothetical protein
MFDNLTRCGDKWYVFQSDSGHLGLGPISETEPGDNVCVFGRGNVPFILRERVQADRGMLCSCFDAR